MDINLLHIRIRCPNKLVLTMLLDTVATQMTEKNQQNYHLFSLASEEIACMLWK